MSIFYKTWFFALFASLLSAQAIVFIHLGPSIPEHLPVAVAQARLFNPACPIYVVAPYNLLRHFHNVWKQDAILEVPTSSLAKSEPHLQFYTQTRLDRHSLGGFWLYTAERFFLLEELMRRENLQDVLHLENDVMLYDELQAMRPAFQTQCGSKIGATFEADDRCVPGFLYVPRIEPLEALTRFMVQRARLGESDMVVLAAFARECGEWIDFLPVLPEDYALSTPARFPIADRSRYARGFAAFHGIFDAAALGQFLAGPAPLHQDAMGPGYINPYAWYTVAGTSIVWEEDDQQRRVPFLFYEGKRAKIHSLHIHSKNLAPFMSSYISGISIPSNFRIEAFRPLSLRM